MPGSIIHPKVGIVADSHGRCETIVAALAFLRDRNSQHIYHLGDICDSLHPETVEDCLRPLMEYAVTAIKGNNDHTIVANQSGQAQGSVSREALSFLQDLPLVKYYRNAVFTHSLPFAEELGLSCMVRDMGQTEVRKFFEESPGGILFRGHSHTAEILWVKAGRISSQTIRRGQTLSLEDRIPCVVNCGALTRGFCMVWRPEERFIECHSFLKGG
jgi:predicted phosphodiesterase